MLTTPSNPNASLPYNLTVGVPYDSRQSITTQSTLQTYVVDNDGYITLTKEGFNTALAVYEKHKYITSFLIHIGVDEYVALEDGMLCATEEALFIDKCNLD